MTAKNGVFRPCWDRLGSFRFPNARLSSLSTRCEINYTRMRILYGCETIRKHEIESDDFFDSSSFKRDAV